LKEDTAHFTPVIEAGPKVGWPPVIHAHLKVGHGPVVDQR